MSQITRRFISGPLSGMEKTVEDTQRTYPHPTPEGTHYYTLRDLKTVKGGEVRKFVYEGYEEPGHDPCTRLIKPDLPKRRRIQLRKPKGRGVQPTTLNAKEVVIRYMRVVKRMRASAATMKRKLRSRANLIKVLKKEENKNQELLEHTVEIHRKDIHNARMAVLELEELLRDVTQYEPMEPTALEFEEYLDCEKDFLQWKFDVQHRRRLASHFSDEYDDANTEDDEVDNDGWEETDKELKG